MSSLKSVLIVTDAWHPQINGVVRSIEQVRDVLVAGGIRVELLTPGGFWTMPMPGYGEIRLSLTTWRQVSAKIRALRPDAIHIATEGPLGIAARAFCIRNKLPFATSYHTQFPEYLRARLPVPLALGYRYLSWFHAPARYCLVPTETISRRLATYGFRNTVIWSRGVDLVQFNPALRDLTSPDRPWPRPHFLYVGRVAVEKNIEQFLRLDLPGTKIVVGDGPSRRSLEARFPEVIFTGPRIGQPLAELYANADCFVFPSRTDTFGLVLLEALAAGTPVAALPVPGPLDVIGTSPVGVLDTDLRAAALAALNIPRESCSAFAANFSWATSADDFLRYLPAIDWPAAPN
ncbi:MAG: alpha-mannosyltransferase [Devosia sp.]|nr:alpha-mannosyltransferase [Devosia sp.]